MQQLNRPERLTCLLEPCVSTLQSKQNPTAMQAVQHCSRLLRPVAHRDTVCRTVPLYLVPNEGSTPFKDLIVDDDSGRMHPVQGVRMQCQPPISSKCSLDHVCQGPASTAASLQHFKARHSHMGHRSLHRTTSGMPYMYSMLSAHKTCNSIWGSAAAAMLVALQGLCSEGCKPCGLSMLGGWQ